MISGLYQGMPFTVFDFHRRPVVTSVHTRWTNKKVNELDTITIDTVRVIMLPAPMPHFQIVSDVESTFDTQAYPEPPTDDRRPEVQPLVQADQHPTRASPCGC